MILVFGLTLFVFSQNFTFVQLSDMHIGFSEQMIPYYEDAVEKVNSLIDEYEIQFALVTGDLTHQALQEELDISVNITEKLKIPYFPILGNHDIRNRITHPILPKGDYRFMKKFEKLFSNITNPNIKYYTGRDPIHFPPHNDSVHVEYLQNYQLEFFDQKLVFLMLDWNNREANLHDYPGGTLPWLEERLKELKSLIEKDSNSVELVIIAQHHEFNCPFYFPCGGSSFSDAQKNDVENVFKRTQFPMDKIWGDISGHIHMYLNFHHVFSDLGKSFREHVDSATRISAAFTLYKVENWEMKLAYQYCADCSESGELTIVRLDD